MSKCNTLCFQHRIDLKQQNSHDVAPLKTIQFITCMTYLMSWSRPFSSQWPRTTISEKQKKRVLHVLLKADLHGTIFAYDCRMRFL